MAELSDRVGEIIGANNTVRRSRRWEVREERM